MLRSTGTKKVGKRGEANIEANRRIREYARSIGMKEMCEMKLDDKCLKGMFGTIAHRHKRNYYQGDTVDEIAEKLSDPKQWVYACQYCHDKQEHNKELTEQIFNKLRGEE